MGLYLGPFRFTKRVRVRVGRGIALLYHGLGLKRPRGGNAGGAGISADAPYVTHYHPFPGEWDRLVAWYDQLPPEKQKWSHKKVEVAITEYLRRKYDEDRQRGA